MTRNLLLDNTKLIMVFLVVIGHLIEPLIDQSIVFETTYKIIYSFHMPVFILISGMLTKQTPKSNYIPKLLKSIAVPLLTFTLLFELYELIANGTVSHYTKSFAPYWIMWFLLSLLIWKITAPFFIKIRHPILISIVIALISDILTQSDIS